MKTTQPEFKVGDTVHFVMDNDSDDNKIYQGKVTNDECCDSIQIECSKPQAIFYLGKNACISKTKEGTRKKFKARKLKVIQYLERELNNRRVEWANL